MLTNSGKTDFFIVKYNSLGNVVWVRPDGGTEVESARGMSVSSKGVYVTGYYSGPSFSVGDYILSGKGADDLFTIQYDLSGDPVWAKSNGGKLNDRSFCVTTDQYDNAYISGAFQSDTLEMDTVKLKRNADFVSSDMFISKLKGNVIPVENCFAYFSTSYNAVQNSFELTVDAATGTTAVAYKWDFGDGTTSVHPLPTHAYKIDKLYNVCMKVYTGAGDSCSYCHIIGKDSTGVTTKTSGFTVNIRNPHIILDANQQESIKPISLFPNPSAGSFIVKGASMDKIEIHNLLGEKIYTSELKQQTTKEINLSTSPKGIYLITIYSGTKIYNDKIIVQ